MRFPAVFLMLLVFLSGCAHVISNESLALSDPGLSFNTLKENPDKYAGKYILLGGVIAGVRNSASGGEMEIVQHDLDSRGRPEDSTSSGGRFLAQSGEFLDPLVFMPGLRVSLVGRVTGKKMLTLDRMEYTYPVVAVKEMRLLKPDRDSYYPIFHFGIGVGHTF